MIAILLGNWPEGGGITSEVLDNSDEVQLIGLLDILQRLESKQLFEKVTSTYRFLLFTKPLFVAEKVSLVIPRTVLHMS